LRPPRTDFVARNCGAAVASQAIPCSNQQEKYFEEQGIQNQEQGNSQRYSDRWLTALSWIAGNGRPKPAIPN
jgi:hypothetical protein